MEIFKKVAAVLLGLALILSFANIPAFKAYVGKAYAASSKKERERVAEREAAAQHSRGQRRQRTLQQAERGEIQRQALEQQELKEKRKKA